MRSHVQSVHTFVRLYDRVSARLTCYLFCSQKYNLEWGLQQLREVWNKNFKSSPAEEDDDVEMTWEGGGSGESSRVDEDLFEKQILLTYETQVL